MKQYLVKRYCFAGLLCMILCHSLNAQDSVRITLEEAEARFVQNNLSLLAERYNINIAKANLLQAKLFENPTISVSANLFDPGRKKFFNVSNSSGQYDIAVQQLVRLAGKRNKEVRLAETSISLSEDKFADLLRTLRYTLRSTFFDLYYLQQSVNSYNRQLDFLRRMSVAYDDLSQKSVVSQKDALRIKSLLYSLSAEQTSLLNRVSEQQSVLQLLLQSNKTWFIPLPVAEPAVPVNDLSLGAMVDTAYVNRPDMAMAEHNLLFEQQNYRLQKALAKPDLTLGAEFDKRGSFVDNASFLTMAIDLPFFKRNQGNIRAAKFATDQGKLLADLQKQTIANDVQAAYSKLINTDKMLGSVDPAFESAFEKMLQGVTENFQKKNISLIEFTDFCESYRNNILQLNQLRNDRRQAMETLQFAVGKKIFN